MNNPFTEEHSIVISPRSIVFVVLFLLTLYFLYLIHGILILLLLAFILMVALRPFSLKLRRTFKVPKIPSIITTYVIFFLVITLFFIVLVPPLISELQQFLSTVDIPGVQEQVRRLVAPLAELRNVSLSEWGTVVQQVGDSFGFVFNVVSSTLGGLFAFITVLVLSVYMMLEREDLYKKMAWFSHDEKHIQQAKDFFDSLEHQLGGWVRGQMVLMLVIFAVNYIGFLLLGIPYALPLAILAGLLEIVPNIGPVAAAVPAILIAFGAHGVVMAIVVTIFATLVQQLEGNFLVPKVMRSNANVNPLVSLVAILSGLKLAGVVGALLAIPIYILMRTIYAYTLKPTPA